MRPPPNDGPSETPNKKLLDQVRQHLRVLHYSILTKDACVRWIRRFVLLHGERQPREMGEPDVERLLTHQTMEGQVAASTQNQALVALPFLNYVELRTKGKNCHSRRMMAVSRCVISLPF
jgi:hypothetical protein